MRRVLWLSVCLGGCAADLPCPAATLEPLSSPPAFAVVSTDYASSAIGLLDADGHVITEAWIDSGTRATGVAAGLSGDVVVAGSAPDGRLVILERYGRDVMSLIALDGLVEQLDLRGDPDTGHSPNPYDVAFVEGGAWVTRYNPAFDPGVPSIARGNDLAFVDLDEGRVTAAVDLGADATLDGTTAYARPAWIARAGDHLAIGLARVSLDFRSTAPGAIAIVALDGRRTALLELDGLAGCQEVQEVDDAHVMVLCTGNAFDGEEERRARAGIVRVAIEADGTAVIDLAFRASEHEGAPTPASGLVVIDAAHVLAVADPRGDDVLAGHDVLLLADLEAGTARTIHEADTSFTIGQGARGDAFLLVPDADARLLRKLSLDGSLLEEIPFPLCRALPPRMVVRLAASARRE